LSIRKFGGKLEGLFKQPVTGSLVENTLGMGEQRRAANHDCLQQAFASIFNPFQHLGHCAWLDSVP
jgi:hypothetical protein